jgi:hypothetical protein
MSPPSISTDNEQAHPETENSTSEAATNESTTADRIISNGEYFQDDSYYFMDVIFLVRAYIAEPLKKISTQLRTG